MHTVPELVGLLGLSTQNQVRNRIEAVRDLLAGFLRRGPNNQLLVTDGGLALLRDLQALCEAGHTLTEAANILRYRFQQDETKLVATSPGMSQDRVKPDQSRATGRGEDGVRWVEHLAAQVRELAARVAALEAELRRGRQGVWWERWR